MLGVSFWGPPVLDIITDRSKFLPCQVFENHKNADIKKLVSLIEDKADGRDPILYVEKVTTLERLKKNIKGQYKVVVFDTPQSLSKLGLTPIDAETVNNVWANKKMPTHLFNQYLQTLSPDTMEGDTQNSGEPMAFSISGSIDKIARGDRGFQDLIVNYLTNTLDDKEWFQQSAECEEEAVRAAIDLRNNPAVVAATHAYYILCVYDKIDLAKAAELCSAEVTLIEELISLKPLSIYKFKVHPPKKLIQSVKKAVTPQMKALFA